MAWAQVLPRFLRDGLHAAWAARPDGDVDRSRDGAERQIHDASCPSARRSLQVSRVRTPPPSKWAPLRPNAPRGAALEEREVIYSKPEMTDEDGIRLGELEGIVGEEDGYEAESNAAILLQGLDIPDELHERKMSELQGGQKVRVLLAQALFGNPDALFLDEPTNYLDLDSIHWLENFLNRYNGTLFKSE